MIKYNGQDLADIKYNGQSIKRVMKDGIQIWPSIPDVPNTPTGIQLSEYEIIDNIEWDYTKMYVGEGDNTNLVTLYFTGQDADVTSIPGNLDWVLYPFNVINTVTVYTDRVELLVNTPFTSASSVTIDYTPGVNPLKDIDGYLLTALNNQALDNILPEPAYTYLLDDYPGAAAAYSLRKLRTGATLSIRIERSTDNAQTDVLLEDEGSLTSDSIVSAGGTLGDWIGSDSAFVATWYDQSGAGFDVTQSTYSSMPQIINNGVGFIRNGKPTINWLTSVITLSGATALSALDSGNQFSMLSVASNYEIEGQVGAIFVTNATASSNRLVLFRDGRTSPIRNFGGASWVDLSTPRTTNQVLQFGIRDATSFYGWDNGDASPQNPLASFVYTNTDFKMGQDRGTTNNFLGYSQELIIWDSDKSTDRVGIETEVNDYYNIWVITAEVDAQLIQADSDNVSDTVIEINGIRSSASDTAVANLISRNVTVITN